MVTINWLAIAYGVFCGALFGGFLAGAYFYKSGWVHGFDAAKAVKIVKAPAR